MESDTMANFKELFFTDSLRKNLIITTDNGNRIDNSMIRGNAKINQSICSDNILRFGNSMSAEFSVDLVNNGTSYEGSVLTVSMELQGESEQFQLGTYKVVSETVSSNKKVRTIVAYDKLYDIINANVADWYNTILPNADSTVTFEAFYTSFCSYFGLSVKNYPEVNKNRIIKKTIQPSELSGKTVLSAICEFSARFCQIRYDGRIDFFTIGTSVETIPSSYYMNASWEDYTTDLINKVQIKDGENDIGGEYGAGDNVYTITDNFLCYGMEQSELDSVAQTIYNEVNGLSYTPMSIQLKGNPAIEIGSRIAITVKGNTIYSYLLSRNLSGVQALRDTFTANGQKRMPETVNSVRDSIVQLKGKSNRLERNINETRSMITDVEQGLQTQITQNASSISAEITRATGAETGLSNRISATDSKFSVKIEEIQKEIDGEIVTYNVSHVPTLLNYPAWDFTYNIPCNNTVACADVPMIYNDEYYSRNARSVVFNEVTSMSYRFTKGENGEWYWRDIGDTDFGIAMQKISELEITTDSISATVEQNQIYNNQQISSMSSRITQTAESITSEVNRATNAEGSLSSSIKQNADAIELRVIKGNISSEISQEAGKISIKSNRFSLESTNCTISEDGTIKATNAELSGKITSSSGKIGGFDIGNNYLSYGKTSFNSSANGIYIGTDGLSFGGNNIGFPALTIDQSGKMQIDYTGGIEIRSSDSLNLTAQNSMFKYHNYEVMEFGSIGSYYNNRIHIKPTYTVLGSSGNYLGFFGDNGSTQKTVAKILTPTSATVSSVATKLNDLLDALKAYNLIKFY